MSADSEQFFRHQYGNLVAGLCRRLGVEHLALAEDAAQSALLKALSHWPRTGEPDDPSAWLFRVARNHALDQLRNERTHRRILEHEVELAGETAGEDTDPIFAAEVPDDLLRMLFVCCDPSIPPESQLVLALKTLCGFGVGEIAQRLFVSEASIYKRLARARAHLARRPGALAELAEPCVVGFAQRTPAVQAVLYLLFTEGHLSSHTDFAIRRELCDEAIRLGLILVGHPTGAVPSTSALLALMYLHRARMDARQDPSGGLLLLAEQDRRRWDSADINEGMRWLGEAAAGEVFSRYHAEASVAAEHCMAPSFGETRWEKIAAAYALLERESPSPLHRLNRAIAVAQWQGATAGLALLRGLDVPTWLEGSYLWSATLADLHRRAGNGKEAGQYRKAALAGAPTPSIRAALKTRLAGSDMK